MDKLLTNLTLQCPKKKVHQVFTKLSCTTCFLYKTSHFLPLGNTKVQFAPPAPGMSLLLRKLRY